ncbi:MAG: chloride channel protein [Eubacteriales bacterium]|nr:chloride channel protein [Eubacteriales bacterium]
MGVLGGILGALFHHTLHFVTMLRAGNPWLIFLLPIGGLLTIALYRVLKLSGNKGTNEIIDATLEGSFVSPAVAPAIFVSTAMTHLFGGSAGREGAALQLGGSMASLVARLLRLNTNERKTLVMAGMSAVFAGLFGTPLTAMLFCMEFVSVGTVFSPALLPCFLSSYIASRVSGMFGVHPEQHILNTVFALDLTNAVPYLLLAVGIAILGIFMCFFFHEAEHVAKKLISNQWIRIVIGGAIIIGMTMVAGNQRFNGAGMDMALAAVSGNAEWYSFILKLLFTAVTLAAGFKGGEIVPTFCIGATFGCVFGGLLGLDPGFAGALGLIGLFCCVTNSPITSIVLSIEMFGGTNVYLFGLICVICFVLSGNSGLYASQIIQFDKMHFASKRSMEDD